MKLSYSFSCIFLLLCFGAIAQETTKTVSGNVVDAQGVPIPGVNIVEKGTTNGVVADFDGKYSIDVSEDAILVFSYVGFQTQEIPVGNQDTLNPTLVEGYGLDEVVVVGYGAQSRETVTTSISKLDTKVLENSTIANVASALQGTVSGVRVQTLSGQPGTPPRVIVRGGTSINNPNGAQPLYVVDNVIREDLVGINTQEIESMQVLKDAAATAIYGARGSNGVVIITTKTGKAGESRISFKTSAGISQLREKYNVLGARDFLFYTRLGLQRRADALGITVGTITRAAGSGTGNDLTKNTSFTTMYLSDENRFLLEEDEGWETMPDPIDPSRTLIFKGTDWQDVMYRAALTRDNYLSFSGGGEKSTFKLGVGYLDQEGILITTNFKRFNADLNGSLEVRDNMTVFGGVKFSSSGDNIVDDEGSIFSRVLGLAPTHKFRYQDGTLASGAGLGSGNPLFFLNNNDIKNSANIMTLNGGLNWELTPDLTFKPSASLLYRINESSSFERSYVANGELRDDRPSSASNSKRYQKQFDGTLTYDKEWNTVHNFQALLGASYFQRENSSLSASGRGAATDLVPTLNASAEPVSVNSFSSEQLLLGYFGRITYNYDLRYLLTINARYDGASNLGRENKWGFFPGISVGWNLHQEDFWKDPARLSTFKLRASYGVNGNLGNLSDYQAQGEYSVGNRYLGNAAVEYTGLANQDLRWEQSKTTDIGFDAGFFDDRVRLIFDVYERVTEDLITAMELPQYTGFNTVLTNLGSLQNRGLELELGATLVNSADFTWDMSFNAAYTKDKILKLPPNENENNRIGGIEVYDPAVDEIVYVSGLQEGNPIGDVYGYQYLGVYPTDEAAAAGPVDEISRRPGGSSGGDVEFLDVDGNGIINTLDQVKMGNIYPEWTGGFSTTAAYKGLSLNVRLDYMTGHTINNYMRGYLRGQFQGALNTTADVYDSWMEQGDITNEPIYVQADQTVNRNFWRNRDGNNSASSLLYEKGDYLAIREVTLSYNLPSSWYESVGLDNLRLNVTGNNLKYFTREYTGQNPEEGGLDAGRYPVPRTIMLALNASF